MVQIIKDNKAVSTSKNLRGILRYASKHGVRMADALPHSDGPGGRMVVMFSDGAYAITDFACYQVLQEWIARFSK